MTDEEIIGRCRSASEIELGTWGESIWKRILKASGFNYIPLADIENGGAPMIEGKTKIVLPDFDVADVESRLNVFVDSKCKSGPIMYRLKNQWRHGIDRRCYQAYCKASEIYLKRSAIGIFEMFNDADSLGSWSGRLLIETLTDLGTPFDGMSNQRHMVYWPVKSFRDVDSLTPQEFVDIAIKGVNVPSYRHELLQILDKRKQGDLFGEVA